MPVVIPSRWRQRMLAWTSTVALAMCASPTAQELRVGADAEGGAPFVEADPRDPSRLVGFEVDIAELIGGELRRSPRFVQSGFTTLDAAVARGDFDIALSGIEDLPVRRASFALTVPYYQFREVLTVRVADMARYRSLADLSGRRVATLGATLAFDLLRVAEREHGVVTVAYEDDVHPYTDLALGRVDAVLLDAVLAERGVRRNAGLANAPTPVGTGRYVGVLAPGATGLRNRIDSILRRAMSDGRLETIFRKWGMWNADQPDLYARVLEGNPGSYTSGATALDASQAAEPTAGVVFRYLPALLTAAGVTVLLSVTSMALAVGLGIAIASGRVYGGRFTAFVLTAGVEILRGTPLLLQLFVIYFGLASVIQLPAVVAAVLALGFNYGAYESEIYRSALLAVPAGQLDAARTLGFSEWQALRLIRGPQALRLALAPMTNDFVALLKDSSLVSVITVVELTKQTSILASNVGTWFVPGALCAGLYLAMSLPLARVARRFERRWQQ